MVNELHSKLLKYAAIFGLVPYIMPIQQQQQQKLLAFEHHQHHPILQQHPILHQHHLHHHHNNIGPLRWQQIYTVTLIVGNLITTLFGVIYLPFGDNFIVSNFVSIMVFIVQILVVILILLETMLSYGKYYELMQHYDKIELLMKQLLQVQLCREEIRKRQSRKYIFYLLTVYVSLIVTTTTISLNEYYGYFWHALGAIIIVRTRCLQLIICMDYIVYYMELVNLKLKALISCKIHKNYLLLDIDYPYLESFDYLENFKIIYKEIYLLHEKFNDLYGLSMACIFTVLFLDIIINMYWTFLVLLGSYKTYVNYITMSTLLPLFVMVFMLCHTGDQCEKQCNILSYSLKRLLKTSSSSGPTDSSYNSLLQDFIMQTIENPITISANAYFTFNLNFLMRVFANIVTYLVILLQFRQTPYTNTQNPEMAANSTQFNYYIEDYLDSNTTDDHSYLMDIV